MSQGSLSACVETKYIFSCLPTYTNQHLTTLNQWKNQYSPLPHISLVFYLYSGCNNIYLGTLQVNELLETFETPQERCYS